jgi:hypothetical protein
MQTTLKELGNIIERLLKLDITDLSEHAKEDVTYDLNDAVISLEGIETAIKKDIRIFKIPIKNNE